MGRSDIHLTINRSLRDVFDIYAQPDPFRWSDMRKVQWSSGKPWEVESRMRIEPNDSLGIVIDQVLTHFEPYKRVDFITHFAGVTMTTQTNFRALADTETQLDSQIEFVGTFSRIAGFALGAAIESGARRFFSQLKAECDRQADSAHRVTPEQVTPAENRSAE